jgi:subtilase family serine protease
MEEGDAAWSSIDQMGQVIQIIDTSDYGLGIGPHTVRSNNGSGDYTVTYEIRRAQLPDLRPVDIKVQEQPGTVKKLVCAVVQNSEATDAGPFDTTLRTSGAVPIREVVKSDGVVSGYWRDVCVEAELTAGEQLLSATVDELNGLLEYNESNNAFERKFVVAGPPPISQADLVVSSIRVRGQVPDGKDDCKEGRNDVAFSLQNLGGTAAGAYLARLAVDDDDVVEKAVEGLDAGKSVDVTFEDVRIKKRTHTLYATADAKDAVTESNENNNIKSVSVSCKDDDE